MLISIVSTLYKSAPFVEEFSKRALAAAGKFGEVELILVDDGSPDESLQIASGLADTRISVVELSRNFGHHKALLAGLSLAKGDKIFLIDSDLEEEPELIIEFNRIMDAGNLDVVFGINSQTEGSLLRRVTSALFWRAFNWATDSSTPINICNVRLMRRAYVDALLSLPEKNSFLGGLFHWVGFKQVGVPIQRSLANRKSTYSLRARISTAILAIVSFSTVPLKVMFWSGVFTATASFGMAVYFFISRINHPNTPLGFTAIIISIWFFSGLIIACLGIIGVYLGYMYVETKNRPRVIIKHVHEKHP